MATKRLGPSTGYFYPRPPRGGRRIRHDHTYQQGLISIHALREEGDYVAGYVTKKLYAFLSTPSARRATDHFAKKPVKTEISIHALREEGDHYPAAHQAAGTISIHALREEGDRFMVGLSAFWQISIHALREEGDRGILPLGRLGTYFYPRPPRGGRQPVVAVILGFLLISIHALREEGDAAPMRPSGTGAISIHALREEGDPFLRFLPG